MNNILRSRRFLNCILCSRRTFFRKVFIATDLSHVNTAQSKCRYLHIFSCQQLAQSLPKTEYTSATFQEQKKVLDRTFYKLDLDVRKSSRLFLQDVEGILNEIQQIGSVSSSHSLLLIRCCGALLPDETLSCRSVLTERVWNILTDLKCQMDVSHYNALLKVHLENEHKFLPTDFLASMEQNGIQPNRVTYQRLVTKYCQEGDIDGASKILEFMKEKELPINETIFNSLVMGHAKSGDMSGAREILDVMRNAKLDPSAHTYSALGCGYARAGDIAGLHQVLKEAEQNEVFLLDEDYLDIIHTLAVNGHSQYITEITPKLPKLIGYNQHCINTIFELMTEGHKDAGFTLLKTMPRTSLPDGELAPAGNFFIRQLIKTNTPLDEILYFCREMKDLDLNDKALVKAVEMSLSHHKADLALPLLKEMQKEGHPVRTHYFWPVFVALRSKGEDATYEVLKTMSEMQCPVTYESYTDFILPNLNSRDPEIIIQKMKDLGENVGSVVNPLIQYYLMNNSLSACVNLIEKYPVRLSPLLLLRVLGSAYKDTGDSTSVLKILKHIQENPEISSSQTVPSDYYGQFIDEYVFLEDHNSSTLENLLNGMRAMNLKISFSSMEKIRNRIKDNPNQKGNIQILGSLASLDIESFQDSGITHPREMSIEDLESHYLELKNKKMNTRGILRRMLLGYCRTRNYTRAIEIQKEMEDEGMEFSPALYSQLMSLCVNSGELDEALKYKNMIEQYPEFSIDDFKILNLAALLVGNDRYNDAKDLILNYKDKFTKRESSEYLSMNVVRVLQAASEKGKAEQAKELFDLLVVRLGFTTPSAKVLGPIVKANLVNGDVSAAIADFETYSSLYKMTPCRNELCKKLIEMDDSENLQKVFDICNTVHGELNALHDLAGSFVECGRIKQAKKIFETPGLRARQGRLDLLCERFLELNMTNVIADLIEATKRLFDVNREKLYWYLLRAYAKENNVPKALSVWTAMQEEDVMPSNKFLVYLADFLKRNDQPIPFTVPTDVEPEFIDSEHQVLEQKSSLKFLIQSGHINEALDEWERLEVAGTPVGINAASNLIEALVRNDRLTEATKVMETMLAEKKYPLQRIFRFFLMKLAHGGDIESIQQMQLSVPPEMMSRFGFDNALAVAYMNCNRHGELLTQWEKDVQEYVNKLNFPAGGYLRYLQNYPELEDRLLQLADRLAKENNFSPLNVVWMHWMISEQFDKAAEVFERLQSNGVEQIMFGSVTSHARRNRNLNIANQLASLSKATNLSSGARGALFGCRIDVLLELGKIDEALSTFKQAISDCRLTVDDFQMKTLKNLQASLLAHGKSVPFVLPSSQRQRSVDTSSSSSDDEK